MVAISFDLNRMLHENFGQKYVRNSTEYSCYLIYMNAQVFYLPLNTFLFVNPNGDRYYARMGVIEIKREVIFTAEGHNTVH